MATTMHRLSHGRYALGLGRGFDVLFDVMGLPRVTGAQLEDAMDIYRRLWRGEAVAGHDGPAGQFPWLQQDATQQDRQSDVWGKSGSVRVDHGGRRILKKKTNTSQ